MDSIRGELKRGKKVGHWIWYVFPQLKGLGQSWNSDHYGISGLPEAKAYLAHPTLGPVLFECTELVNAVEGRSIDDILGGIDALKFRSSMTLFLNADDSQSAFRTALDKYFDGEIDPLTIELLGRAK